MLSATKRLAKELPKVLPAIVFICDATKLDLTLFSQIHSSLPPGISLVSAEGFDEWFMDIIVLDANPLYMNETYRLKFKFSNSYPIGQMAISIAT